MMFSQAFADVPVRADRNESQYNNQYAVVLNGYDPVSYFPEGGSTPQVGSTGITFTYGTRMYHFVSEANKALFKSNPLKFEPTYGSFCAWAMVNNRKVMIDPTIYTVNGNRLHFFVSPQAKSNFDADVLGYEVIADQNFFDFSGEKPRK